MEQLAWTPITQAAVGFLNYAVNAADVVTGIGHNSSCRLKLHIYLYLLVGWLYSAKFFWKTIMWYIAFSHFSNVIQIHWK